MSWSETARRMATIARRLKKKSPQVSNAKVLPVTTPNVFRRPVSPVPPVNVAQPPSARGPRAGRGLPGQPVSQINVVQRGRRPGATVNVVQRGRRR